MAYSTTNHASAEKDIERTLDRLESSYIDSLKIRTKRSLLKPRKRKRRPRPTANPNLRFTTASTTIGTRYRRRRPPPIIKPSPRTTSSPRPKHRGFHSRCRRQAGGRSCKSRSKSTFHTQRVHVSPHSSKFEHTQKLLVSREQFQEFHSFSGKTDQGFSRISQQARANNGISSLSYSHTPKEQKKLINKSKTNEVSLVQNFQKEVLPGDPSVVNSKLSLDFDRSAAQIAADHSSNNFYVPTLRRSKSTSSVNNLKSSELEPNSGYFRTLPLAKLRVNDPMISLQDPRPLRSYNIKSDPTHLLHGNKIPGQNSDARAPVPAPRISKQKATARPVDFRLENSKLSKCGGAICDHISLGSLTTPSGKILSLSSGSNYEKGGLRPPKPLPRNKNNQFLQVPGKNSAPLPKTLKETAQHFYCLQ